MKLIETEFKIADSDGTEGDEIGSISKWHNESCDVCKEKNLCLKIGATADAGHVWTGFYICATCMSSILFTVPAEPIRKERHVCNHLFHPCPKCNPAAERK